MPKEEWGTKRVCPTTGKRFYDLNRDPVVSPYTGEVVPLDTGKSRPLIAEKRKPQPETEAEDVVLEDDSEAPVEIEDDVLEDDADENVSLDELADVAGDDEES